MEPTIAPMVAACDGSVDVWGRAELGSALEGVATGVTTPVAGASGLEGSVAAGPPRRIVVVYVVVSLVMERVM